MQSVTQYKEAAGFHCRLLISNTCICIPVPLYDRDLSFLEVEMREGRARNHCRHKNTVISEQEGGGKSHCLSTRMTLTKTDLTRTGDSY